MLLPSRCTKLSFVIIIVTLAAKNSSRQLLRVRFQLSMDNPYLWPHTLLDKQYILILVQIWLESRRQLLVL